MPAFPSHRTARLGAVEKPTWVRVLEAVLLYAIFAGLVSTGAVWVLHLPPG